MANERRTVHTYPINGPEHVTDGFGCWCGPRIEMACPECEAENTGGCWRCDGVGWVACPNPEMYDGATGLHVVHAAASEAYAATHPNTTLGRTTPARGAGPDPEG